MGGVPVPTINPIQRPSAPTPPVRPVPATPSPVPKKRAMDTYPSAVADAFKTKEDSFFNGATYEKDDVIDVTSSFGFFKIDRYPNPWNASDIQYVVFFYNRATAEVYEVHGTIALFYLRSVRNQTNATDFPISDTRVPLAHPDDSINYFSNYSLRWEQASNNVIRWLYKSYEPAQATVPARQHDFDPTQKITLVGYTEEYAIASDALGFNNWKDENDLGKYNNDIGFRASGRPCQILLHETAAFNDLAISKVRQEKSRNGGTFFPIPHFCVNNLDAQGKGQVIQFVDIATNVPHGERTNDRSVGIEFVNAPIEAFAVDKDNKLILPLQPIFHLDQRTDGIYLQTRLKGLPHLFIPLEFSADANGGYYELAVSKKKLLNYAALKGGVGPKKINVLKEDADNILIKFAKSDKFEQLATLVSKLVTNQLIRGLDDLTNEKFWQPVMTDGEKKFYVFEHAWSTDKDKTVFFFTDIREPAILTHLFIGSHADGGLQGLYLYLKFVRKVTVEAILNLMIAFLTKDPVTGSAPSLTLESKLMVPDQGALQPTPTPIKKTFRDLLELEDDLISAVTTT